MASDSAASVNNPPVDIPESGSFPTLCETQRRDTTPLGPRERPPLDRYLEVRA